MLQQSSITQKEYTRQAPKGDRLSYESDSVKSGIEGFKEWGGCAPLLGVR